MIVYTYLNRHKTLLLAGSCCCFLVLFRFVISLEYYYFFLIWNLFLAGIPFLLSEFISKTENFMATGILGMLWLLFLPNSFYGGTDLIHLQNSNRPYFDVFIIGSFAVLCCWLGFKSIQHMEQKFEILIPKIISWLIKIGVLFLCSFGIYLGRFLRYNSWNLLSDPYNLLEDCFSFLRFPVRHLEVWLFTIVFGLVLTGLYYIYLHLNPKNATE